MKTTPRSLPAVLLAIPVLLALASRGEQLGYGPKDGTTLVKKFAIQSELSLEEMTLEVNGQDMSQMADIEMAMKVAQVLAVTDRYEAVGQGRPARLKRTYDEVSSSTHVSASMPTVGDQDLDIPGTSELEGTSVVFTWDEDGGDYDVAFAEGSDGDEALLENLTENLDLRGFLPGKEISAGDTWEIPVDAVKAALAPGGALKLEPDRSDERFSGMGGIDQFNLSDMVSNLDGKFSAEFVGTREEDGVRVAAIKLEIEARSAQDLSDKVAEMKPDLPEGLEMEVESSDMEFELEAEGELLWNLESGLPYSFELSGDIQVITDMSMSIKPPGQEQTMKQSMSMTFGGNQTLTLATGD